MQMKGIFNDQQKIDPFGKALVEFAEKIDLGGEQEEGAEEGGGAKIDDRNVFYLPDELVNVAGGGPVDPSYPDPELLGKFDYREFESREDLFAYT